MWSGERQHSVRLFRRTACLQSQRSDTERDLNGSADFASLLANELVPGAQDLPRV
jgi:hypothetical protein